MNDQEQPKPEEQPIIPEVVTPITDPSIKLEELPPEPLQALDRMIKQGFGSRKIKAELEKNFGPIKDILPAGRSTYERYIDKHYDRIENDKKTEAFITDSLKTDTALLKGSISEILKGHKGTAREKLDLMDKYFIERMDLLEKIQAQGNLSAQIESILLNYTNAYRTFLETKIEFDQHQDKEKVNVMVKYIRSLKATAINKTITAYRKVHGDFKLLEFTTELGPAIIEAFDAHILQVESPNRGENN